MSKTSTSVLLARCATAALLAGLAFAGGSPARAQTAAPDPEPTTSTVEDVVVTATRTGATNVQDTPIAITALSAERLENSGATSIRDLATLAPSLQVSENSGWAQLFVRGIGTNVIYGGADASTTVHIDGVYMGRPFNAFSDFLDVERIEVLRGPQGTLYGRNSVAGTINVITAAPSDVLEGKVLARYGNFNAVDVSAAVSGPLSDTLRGSLAALYSSHDGRIENIYADVSDFDSKNSRAVRGKLMFEPSSAFDVTLAADYSLDTGRPSPAYKLTSRKPTFTTPFVELYDDLYKVSINLPASGRTESQGVSLTANAALSDVFSLRSITAYRESSNAVSVDTDSTELNLRRSDIAEDQSQFSQELQLNYTTDRIKAVGGLYYFTETVDSDLQINIFPPANLRLFFNPHNETESYAAYGQATFSLTDRLSLTAGVRYGSETKTIRTSGGQSRLATPDILSTFAYSDKLEFENWTPKIGLEFKVNPDILIYGTISKGFKSGGFNASTTVAGRGFRPEELIAYEAGIKSELLNNRLRLNVAAFHYDYTDLQVQTFVPPGVVDVANAASATMDGVEIEAQAVLSENLRIGGFVNYLHGAYGPYIAVVNGAAVDVTGRTIIQAPEWKVGFNVNYEHDLGAEGQIFAFGEVAWQDNIYFTPDNTPLLEQDGYALVNGRIGYRPADRDWSVAAYVRNAFNTEYLVSGDSVPPPGYGGRPGVPRTFGVELTANF